jgi:hypothetical protein
MDVVLDGKYATDVGESKGTPAVPPGGGCFVAAATFFLAGGFLSPLSLSCLLLVGVDILRGTGGSVIPWVFT